MALEASSSATRSHPTPLCSDGAGGVFIGTVNIPGNSGDGGPATASLMRYPEQCALDGTGGLIVADTNAHVVRRINSGGIISTVAGNGSTGCAGNGGPATQAMLKSPRAVASLGVSTGFWIVRLRRGGRGCTSLTSPNDAPEYAG